MAVSFDVLRDMLFIYSTALSQNCKVCYSSVKMLKAMFVKCLNTLGRQ